MNVSSVEVTVTWTSVPADGPLRLQVYHVTKHEDGEMGIELIVVNGSSPLQVMLPNLSITVDEGSRLATVVAPAVQGSPPAYTATGETAYAVSFAAVGKLAAA